MLDLIWRWVWAVWVREARNARYRQAEPGCNTSAHSIESGAIISLESYFLKILKKNPCPWQQELASSKHVYILKISMHLGDETEDEDFESGSLTSNNIITSMSVKLILQWTWRLHEGAEHGRLATGNSCDCDPPDIPLIVLNHWYFYLYNYYDIGMVMFRIKIFHHVYIKYVSSVVLKRYKWNEILLINEFLTFFVSTSLSLSFISVW